MPTTGPDQQQQQHQPPLQSPLSLLSPHHQLPHPALLSPPPIGMGLPLANMAHVFDPRAFDRSMQHHHLPPQPSPYSLPGLLGMGPWGRTHGAGRGDASYGPQCPDRLPQHRIRLTKREARRNPRSECDIFFLHFIHFHISHVTYISNEVQVVF